MRASANNLRAGTFFDLRGAGELRTERVMGASGSTGFQIGTTILNVKIYMSACRGVNSNVDVGCIEVLMDAVTILCISCSICLFIFHLIDV